MTTATLTPPHLPVAETWNPRCDPFVRDLWLTYLVTHAGEWTHPSDLWQTNDEWQASILRNVAYETVVAARRLGYVIEGDRQRGYCYRRSVLVRYLHIRDDIENDEYDSEQLSMCEAEGVVSAP